MSSLMDRVGRTCLIIAAWRAREAERIDPLFIDSIANIFIDSEAEALENELARASASSRCLISYRTKYFDQALLKEMDRGVRQVVLLGAGLDTRSLRLGDRAVRFFEVDQHDVLGYKQQQLGRYGYTACSRFIDGDYIRDDILRLLEDHGFNPNSETYFIWEGNTMYIPAQEIFSLLSKLKKQIASFRISFDYLSEEMIQRTTGFEGASELVKGFESMGAPWVTGFKDIYQVAQQTDLTVVENKLIIDAVEPSRSRVSMDRGLFCNYSVCTLSSRGKG